VTAQDVSYNGTLPAGGTATFGFRATAGAANRVPTLTGDAT
jgi:hypothetical protein